MQATKVGTIMIVEDDAAVRELLVLSLESHDFETVAAGNTADAITRLESTQVDLLLLDLRLGDENGIDLLKAVRRLPRYERLPVILLTGCADRNVVMQVAQLGVQGYLLKHQFSRKELVARIGQLLKDRSASESCDDRQSPDQDDSEPGAAGQFEGGQLFTGVMGVVKPLLTRAQTIERLKKKGESNAFLAAVAGILKAPVEPQDATDQIVKVVRSFRATEPRKHFSYELFWEHSIATGLIAAQLTRLRENNPEAINFAFTMGLLHDVAQIVLGEQLADIYDRVLDAAARLQAPLEQVESRMLLANHADLASLVLDPQSLPIELIESITLHHLPADSILNLLAHKLQHVATLALADRLAHGLLLGFGGNNSHYPTERLSQALDATAETFENIEQQIPGKTADLMSKVFRWGGGIPGSEYRQRALRRFRKQIRPMYVGAHPATDAYRLLLRRLAAANHNRGPNIAVLYLANISHAQSLFKNLQDRENAVKSGPLPLILISPLANSQIDPELVASRQFKKLPAPFTLFQLADMTDSLLTTVEE
jgi:CheY-like chemotaxis protein